MRTSKRFDVRVGSASQRSRQANSRVGFVLGSAWKFAAWRPIVLAWWAWALPLYQGCAHGSRMGVQAAAMVEPQVSTAHHPPDPLQDVVAATPGRVPDLASLDEQELFHLARELDRAKRPHKSIAAYNALLERFPSSSLANPSRFNLGLLFEQEKQFEQAGLHYRAIVDGLQPASGAARQTWVDAHYRLAICLGKVEHWWQSVAIFDRVLEFEELDPYDRFEALAGRAIAIQHAGDADLAEIALEGVLHFYRESARRGRLDDNGLLAEVSFRMGEIAGERFRSVILEFPSEVLAERLEQKCQFLVTAQRRYLQAIRFGDSHTVAVAGFRIGELYESLFDSILGLEIPPDLTEEEAEVYRDEVRNRIQILLKKALRVYERAAFAGRRAPTAKSWLDRLERSITRLRRLLLEGQG